MEDLKKFEGEVVSFEELDLIWEDSKVEKVEDCGMSGANAGQHWWVVYLTSGEEVNVYTKEEEE